MNKHLDKYLCDKYPKIFEDRYKTPQETCMCWGFPDEGWFFLLNSLCSSIQHRINHPPYVYKRTPYVYAVRAWNGLARLIRLPYSFQIYGDLMEPGVIPQVVADQVKEKFGGLRFYYHGGDKQIQGMVSLAEAMSYCICESCGAMNEFVSQTSGGWIKTSCVNCSKGVDVDPELIAAWANAKLDKFNAALKDKERQNKIKE